MATKLLISVVIVTTMVLWSAAAEADITTTPSSETITIQEEVIVATPDSELATSENTEEETKIKRTIDHHLGYGYDPRYQRQFADQQRAATYNQQVAQKYPQKYQQQQPQYSTIKYHSPQQNYQYQQSHHLNTQSLSQSAPTTLLTSASPSAEAQRHVVYAKPENSPSAAYIPSPATQVPNGINPIYTPSRLVLPPVYSQDASAQETAPYMATHPIYLPQQQVPAPIPVLLHNPSVVPGINGHAFAQPQVVPIIILRLHNPGLGPLTTPYVRPSSAYLPSHGASNLQSLILQYLQAIQQQQPQQHHAQHQTTQVYLQPDAAQNVIYMDPSALTQTEEKFVYIPQESAPQKESYITKKPLVNLPGSQYSTNLAAKYRKHPDSNAQVDAEYNIKYANLKEKPQ